MIMILIAIAKASTPLSEKPIMSIVSGLGTKSVKQIMWYRAMRIRNSLKVVSLL